MRRYRLPRFRRHRDALLFERKTAVVPPRSPSIYDTTSIYSHHPTHIEYDAIYADEEGAALLEGGYRPEFDDFLPSPPKLPGPLDRSPQVGDLRPALGLFLIFWVVSLHDWREAKADGLWVSGDRVFRHHENWRLATALFAHADIGHLLSNAPLFLIFGWYLYAYFGPWIFPGAAVLVGVLSNLATVHFYAAQERLLGASGMLYGMVALWLVLYMRFETNLKPPVRFMRALGVSLLLLFPTTFEPTTSYLAHAMGFSIGLVLGLIVWPIVKLQPGPDRYVEPIAPRLVP